MSQQDIADQVVDNLKLFIRELHQEIPIVTSSRLSEDLHVDSSSLVDIVLELEGVFHVELGDDIFEKAKTVGDLVDAIQAHQTSKQ
jgi:acyl carrier protein